MHDRKLKGTRGDDEDVADDVVDGVAPLARWKGPATGPLDAETETALELVAQRDGERVATLRSRRAAAAKEVSDAERALMSVKTAVEDAEAIYNDVRADIAAGHHHEGAHHDDDEAHAEDDWDKYLHFGEGHHAGEEASAADKEAGADKKPPAGYVTTYTVAGAPSVDFSFVTIRLAGHMVPTFQPAASLAFFTRFLAAEPM